MKNLPEMINGRSMQISLAVNLLVIKGKKCFGRRLYRVVLFWLFNKKKPENNTTHRPQREIKERPRASVAVFWRLEEKDKTDQVGALLFARKEKWKRRSEKRQLRNAFFSIKNPFRNWLLPITPRLSFVLGCFSLPLFLFLSVQADNKSICIKYQ